MGPSLLAPAPLVAMLSRTSASSLCRLAIVLVTSVQHGVDGDVSVRVTVCRGFCSNSCSKYFLGMLALLVMPLNLSSSFNLATVHFAGSSSLTGRVLFLEAIVLYAHLPPPITAINCFQMYINAHELASCATCNLQSCFTNLR